MEKVNKEIEDFNKALDLSVGALSEVLVWEKVGDWKDLKSWEETASALAIHLESRKANMQNMILLVIKISLTERFFLLNELFGSVCQAMPDKLPAAATK